MKKAIPIGLLLVSINASAFLDFNSYGPGYKDNDWPIWTPMYWMEKITDNDTFGNNRYNKYPYPYNARPFNTGASHFNMSQMPTPAQAYQQESNNTLTPNYMTPAAMSFYSAQKNNSINGPISPYPMGYNFVEPRSPYGRGF